MWTFFRDHPVEPEGSGKSKSQKQQPPPPVIH